MVHRHIFGGAITSDQTHFHWLVIVKKISLTVELHFKAQVEMFVNKYFFFQTCGSSSRDMLVCIVINIVEWNFDHW